MRIFPKIALIATKHPWKVRVQRSKTTGGLLVVTWSHCMRILWMTVFW